MIYGIALIIGIILLVYALNALKESITFVKNSVQTIGTVTELEQLSDSDGDTYRPIFTFRIKDNKEYTYTHPVSSSRPGWAVGDQIKFAYDAGHPETARFLSYSSIFNWPVRLLSIALPLIVLGAGYFLFLLCL
ncbi:hypothetical protein HDE69_000459 [Pedobacter cryoconitis]|uniref:DUF3592 domain-containing protein n=1 Tax=Pedobacter cryoconitis TaxID=188932 RepID=A0A7W8YQ01_9SPHI|nr:DUF3592 domain-containing protein [Pedobacter cryoconitis]MBB5619423.1 hypothetical protein [Pedobacter cryoconitis]MBB5644711.1 hypothetical protein [Pedobacter cryoconitis]